mgnify:CR=1 FL=1
MESFLLLKKNAFLESVHQSAQEKKPCVEVDALLYKVPPNIVVPVIRLAKRSQIEPILLQRSLQVCNPELPPVNKANTLQFSLSHIPQKRIDKY